MVIALALVRTLIGLLFVAAGIAKLVTLPASAANFARWGLPAPDAAVIVTSAVEIVCGALFALGALTRPVGMLLATVMVVAMVTAGRTDGGANLALPAVLFVATVFFAWRSGRYGGRKPERPPGVQ